MRFIFKDKDLTIYINKQLLNFNIYEKSDIESFVKKLILRIKKKYENISGFYKANVYHNSNYGIIIEFIKQDDLDLFPDLIDLKLILYYDSNMYLKIDDYFLLLQKEIFYLDNSFYVDIISLTNKEIISLCEFGDFIYGEKLEEIKDSLVKL